MRNSISSYAHGVQNARQACDTKRTNDAHAVAQPAPHTFSPWESWVTMGWPGHNYKSRKEKRYFKIN